MIEKKNEMTELKPCPFCGSRDVTLQFRGIVYVTCLMCMAEGPYTTVGETPTAVELWNTRVDGQKDKMEKSENNQVTNPRYLEYCTANGFENDPDGMLEHDKILYPSKVMTGFICWHLKTRRDAINSDGTKRYRR